LEQADDCDQQGIMNIKILVSWGYMEERKRVAAATVATWQRCSLFENKTGCIRLVC